MMKKKNEPSDESNASQVRVHQEHIDGLLNHYPKKSYVSIQMIKDDDKYQSLRTFVAEAVASVKMGRDEDDAMLQRYHAKVYAEVEVEVKDAVEDDKDDGFVG